MDKQIAIYGAGGQGAILHDALRRDLIEPDFFIDQFTAKTRLFDKPVCRLAAVERPSDVIVYVSVETNVHPGLAADYDLIADLRGRGFADVIDFAQCQQRHAGVIDGFAARTVAKMRAEGFDVLKPGELARVRGLLCDAKSAEVLDRIIRFRRTLEIRNYVTPDGETEYFPGDVPVFGTLRRIRFADCGAYCGDTLLALLSSDRPPVDFIAAFEPDPMNLRTLAATSAQLAQAHPGTSIVIYPCGTWSETAILRFSSGKATSSRLATDGADGTDTISVPVTSLDIALAGAAPNFIKMDIEGSELDALRGAERIIREHKPVLAICVYHKPDDLWTIPLFIHALNPGYRMYLRQHAHMATSTVLYCIDG